jgi:hypothetical protein
MKMKMKKLIVAAFAAMLGIAANAAAIEWGMTGVTDSPDTAKAAGWAVYVMDASTFDAFSALSGTEVAAYAAANALFTGATTSGRTGTNANVTDGDYAAGTTVNSYMVVFNNAAATDATYYAYTGKNSTTIAASGADGAMQFGSFTDATSSTGGWTATAVPEPTSGLLMLVGLAGLALRRRRA